MHDKRYRHQTIVASNLLSSLRLIYSDSLVFTFGCEQLMHVFRIYLRCHGSWMARVLWCAWHGAHNNYSARDYWTRRIIFFFFLFFVPAAIRANKTSVIYGIRSFFLFRVRMTGGCRHATLCRAFTWNTQWTKFTDLIFANKWKRRRDAGASYLDEHFRKIVIKWDR